MVRSLKVGVVGCGYIASNAHLPTLSRHPSVKEIHISDLDETLMKSLGKKFGIPENRMYKSFKDFIPYVDVVFVLTPPHTHFYIIKECVKSDKHVFVEKPLCISTKEAKDIVKFTRYNKGRLVIATGFNLRFMPQMKLGKKLLSKGYVGSVVALQGNYLAESVFNRNDIKDGSFYLDSSKGGGVLNDGIPHLIDIASWLLNSSVSEGKCILGNFEASGLAVDTVDSITLKFDNGVVGQLLGLWAPLSEFLYTKELKSVRIIGTKGIMTIELYGGGIELYRKNKGLNRIYPKGSDVKNPMWALSQSYKTQCDAFIKSVLDGIEYPVSVEHARNIVEIVECLKESNKYGS